MTRKKTVSHRFIWLQTAVKRGRRTNGRIVKKPKQHCQIWKKIYRELFQCHQTLSTMEVVSSSSMSRGHSCAACERLTTHCLSVDCPFKQQQQLDQHQHDHHQHHLQYHQQHRQSHRRQELKRSLSETNWINSDNSNNSSNNSNSNSADTIMTSSVHITSSGESNAVFITLHHPPPPSSFLAYKHYTHTTVKQPSSSSFFLASESLAN